MANSQPPHPRNRSKINPSPSKLGSNRKKRKLPNQPLPQLEGPVVLFANKANKTGGWFLNFHCFTNFVRVAFFNGASLRPPPPGASKVKNVRYLDLREGEPIDEAQLADWVKQASQLPGWSGG